MGDYLTYTEINDKIEPELINLLSADTTDNDNEYVINEAIDSAEVTINAHLILYNIQSVKDAQPKLLKDICYRLMIYNLYLRKGQNRTDLAEIPLIQLKQLQSGEIVLEEVGQSGTNVEKYLKVASDFDEHKMTRSLLDLTSW